MTIFHTLLGLAVVVGNGGAAVDGLVLHDTGDRFWNLAGLGHIALALQVASGFFLITSIVNGPSGTHALIPALSLGAVLAGRSVRGDRRALAVAVASIVVLVAAVYAFATGVAARS